MSTSTVNLTPEAQVAISHLRALTVSQKHPAKIRDLLRDYREIEGVFLPFKNYGFKTVEDFLRASGEFLMINYQGEISVTALPSAESAHIKQMVSRQSTKQRRRGPPARLPSRTDQSWNKSSFSSSNVSRNLRMPPIRRMNNNRSNQNYNNNNNYQQSRNNYGGSLVRQISGSGGGDANNNCNQSNNRNITTVTTTNFSKQQSISKPAAVVPLMDIQIQLDSLDLRDRLNQKRNIAQQQQQPPLQQQQQKLTQLSRPILGQNGATNQNSSTKDIQTFSEYLNKNHNIQPPSSSIQRNGQQIENNNKNGGDEIFTNHLNNRMNTTEHIIKNKFAENDQLKKSIINVPNTTISSKKVSSIQNRLKITITNNITNNSEINNTPPPVSSEDNALSSMPSTPTTSSPAISSINCNSNDSNSSSNSIGHDLQYEFSIIDKAMKEESKVINEPKSMPKIFSNEFQFNPNLSSSVSLAQYCTVRQLPRPHYDILKPRFGGGVKRIQCRVNINNIIYSTYPDDFSDEETAIEACAKIAINDIKEIEHKIHVPLCMDSDCELAMKIYQELKLNYPCGIFAKMFPDVFEKTFKQSLPDHWWTIIQDSQQFILESTAGDNFILFANIESESSSNASNISEHEEQDNEYIIRNRLNLPWDDKYWNLYITHCVSTSEIWARIVHKDYSEKLDTLLTDIDMSMLSDKKRPVSLIIGQFYLVCISECWLRIRLDNIDKGSGKCLCFFVDFGDDDLLAMDQLYICDKKFLELPPQAIPFSLFGLEDFTENPIAKKNIDTMLLNKGLIAEIITKRENYDIMMKNYEENINNCVTTTNTNNIDFISKIQIVLYDTSSNEDVNLNPLLLNQICDETPPPELKNNGVTNVNITHINDNGEVYLQVRTLRLHYVEKLIHQLVQSKFNEDQHKVNPIDIKRSNLFLIKDNADQRWYRGCLIDNDFNIDDQYFNIFYVDYGNIKNIPITNIFRLESLSTALNKFPWQAIKTKLHNLPPMNSNVVARIRGLLRINYPAIVKLAVLSLDNSRNVVPQIIAFVRIERSHSLCNVNEAIRMEHELESSLELENELDFKKFDSESSGNSLSPISPNYKHPSNVLSEMTACIRNVNVKSSTNNEPLPKLSSNSWIPDIGQLFNVLVTISSNPFNFLIQSYNDFPKYQDMMTELQVYCKSSNEYIPSDMIEVGEAYAVLKSDNLYYRASVEGVFPSDMTCVFFCDCGDVAVVNNSAIKILPRKFRTIPKQAIQAKLHGIKPVHGEWTTDDSIRFRELTLGHKFASVIRNISIDNFDPKKPKVLELTLIDVSTEEDIYIHKILVDEKRAILSS